MEEVKLVVNRVIHRPPRRKFPAPRYVKAWGGNYATRENVTGPGYDWPPHEPGRRNQSGIFMCDHGKPDGTPNAWFMTTGCSTCGHKPNPLKLKWKPCEACGCLNGWGAPECGHCGLDFMLSPRACIKCGVLDNTSEDKVCWNCDAPASESFRCLTPDEVKQEETRMGKSAIHWFDKLEVLVKANASQRMLLVGPPGTGKSTTAKLLLGKNTQRLTMTEGTGVEDLLGMYHLREGETVWVDGPVATAMRHGYGIVIDEIDHMPTEIQSLAYAVLDDEPQITLPTGEQIIAADGYRVICTSNANISVLPEAVMDRIEAVFIAAKPHPLAMDDLSDAERAAVENYYRGVAITPWKWSGLITLRRMRAYHYIYQKVQDKLSDADVATAVFGEAGKEVLSVLSTASR